MAAASPAAPPRRRPAAAKISNSLCASPSQPPGARARRVRAPRATSTLRHPHRGFQIHREHLREHRLERGRPACATATTRFSPPSGNACITGSTNETAPSNAAPMPSSTADRPSGVVAAAGGIQRGARCEHRDHPRDVRRRRRRRRSRFERSAQLGALHQPRRSITHASRSSSLDSNPHSQSSPLAPGTARESSAEATPPPCLLPADRLEERDDGAGGKSQAPLGGVAPAPCCCAPKRQIPTPSPVERTSRQLRAHAAQQTGPGGYAAERRQAGYGESRSARTRPSDSSGTTLT